MKLNIFNILVVFCFLNLTSCEKKEDAKKSMKPEVLSEDSYSPKTICDCNDDGLELLNNILIKRKDFKNFDAFSKNQKVFSNIEILKKNWKTIQYKCLKTFGAVLMRPSNCNEPDKIQILKNKLLKLGINT